MSDDDVICISDDDEGPSTSGKEMGKESTNSLLRNLISCSLPSTTVVTISPDIPPKQPLRSCPNDDVIMLSPEPLRGSPVKKARSSPKLLQKKPSPDVSLLEDDEFSEPATKQMKRSVRSESDDEREKEKKRKAFDTDPFFSTVDIRISPPRPVKATSDGDVQKKKKVRLDEEEKKRREEEKETKKKDKEKEREEKKKGVENEKLLRKIEREASASKKSKAEQYLVCRVGQAVLDGINGFDVAIRTIMADRNIGEQLEVPPPLGSRVQWWRKHVEAVELVQGKGAERVESLMQEPVEVIVTDAPTLISLQKANSLEAFVLQERSSLSVGNALLIILVHGKFDIRDSLKDTLSVALHESMHTQIREVHSAAEAAMFICQLHRSIAKMHVRRSERIIVDVTKGTRYRSTLVTDWWSKMLGMVPRISGIYARAIAANLPNPIRLLQRIEKEGKDAIEAEIADIRTDIGNRIGAARANKLIMLLTSEDGMAPFA